MKQPEPVYKLLDWIDINKLDWYRLSESLNPNVISLLEKYPEKIYWFKLSQNPNAIALLEKYPEKIHWGYLSQNTNPNAMHLLEKNLDKLDTYCWEMLSKNLNATALLEKNLDKLDRTCWSWLSENPNAMHILEKNPHKIDWFHLSKNSNPYAISLLEKNPDKISCFWLSKNPNAMHILEKNQHKLDRSSWSSISDNPSMFEIDYKTMTNLMVDNFREDLMKAVFHPKRISAWLDAGFEDF